MFSTATKNTGKYREKRVKNLANHCYFSLLASLPPREKALSCSPDKKQLINLVIEFVRKKIADAKFRNSIVIARSAYVPFEFHDSLMIQHYDLITTHEETDIVIVR